ACALRLERTCLGLLRGPRLDGRDRPLELALHGFARTAKERTTMTDTTETSSEQPAKKLGRPRKADPQRVDYHQLDTLLVMGEMRVDADRGPVTEYPSYRELAKR